MSRSMRNVVEMFTTPVSHSTSYNVHQIVSYVSVKCPLVKEFLFMMCSVTVVI
jgi:hypothetical protein